MNPHPTVAGRGVLLRPTTEADLGLLTDWFSRPGFTAYWGGRARSRDEVAAKYVGKRRPEVECFVVERAGKPVGWMQYHVDGQLCGGLDLVLLDEHRGSGIGRAAVDALTKFLTRELGWTEVTVDPEEWNVNGRAFWASVGFTPIRTVTDDPKRAPFVLMRWTGVSN